MKKVTIVLTFLMLCLLLTGCRGLRISSIDDLISPVSPSGDDAGILAAVDDYCKGGYSIKIPSGGNYTTSFISCDLNDDQSDEAIAFFEPADKIGVVNMAVLTENSSSWNVVSNISGEGTDVNRVDFCDVNNDGKNEIIVCWGMLSNSVTSNLCVYRVNDDFSAELVADSVTAGDFICVDINDDGANELLVFNYGGSGSSPKAELYSFTDNEKDLIGETKLDSTIDSISSIACARTDEGMSVFADAVRSNGDSMVTELLYWSDYYDSVISPFYSYSTGRTKDTTRNNTITCRDVDNDNELEIPLDKSVSGLPKELTAQSWVSFKNTVLIRKAYSIACKKDGYLLRLNDDIFEKMSFKYDEDRRELTLNDGTGDSVKILTVIKSSYDSESYSGYTQIFSDSGFVYLASVNDNAEIKISIDELKNSIKSY